MRVLLVGNYAPSLQYSMLGFGQVLAKGLSSAGIDFTSTAPVRRLGGRSGDPDLFGKWLAYVDKFVLFRGELRRQAKSHDVIHVLDQGNGLYVGYLRGRNTLLTCHDVLAARSAIGEIRGWYTGWTGRWFQRMNLDCLRDARTVACVSQATLRDVIDLAGRTESRTKVIYNGMYKPFAPVSAAARAERLGGLGLAPDASYLLHVGGNAPYKNRLGVIQIFREFVALNPSACMGLVMAGKPLSPDLGAYVRTHGLVDRIRELPDVPDEVLSALYSQAKGLLFPSLYEGFGLPIIEAQACGCPVFCSNRAPMTEVGGGAAVYFDPEDVPGAARLIAANLGCTESMTQAGLENVKRFTTERMVSEYIELYKSTL